MSEEEIKADLEYLSQSCLEKTGVQMRKYFRFPEGKYSEEALKAVSDLGYKTIFWSLAYADWDNGKQPGEEYAMKLILSNTHNGAVILLHPNSKTNAKILQNLIDEWRRMGYSFGTLDELCK
jgi:peptidoglycan-N-acetylmuramic acid deacetylase